jgi:hypothetical protein
MRVGTAAGMVGVATACGSTAGALAREAMRRTCRLAHAKVDGEGADHAATEFLPCHRTSSLVSDPITAPRHAPRR